MNSVAGENLDITIKGQRLHIQTEDWGEKEGLLVSRIFQSGSVIKTYKLAYEKIKNVSDLNIRRQALIKFHNLVIETMQKT